jgi:hypothetical protein
MQRARDAVFGAPKPATNGHGPADSTSAHLDQLERLTALHDTGALSDAEFAAEKAALVG